MQIGWKNIIPRSMSWRGTGLTNNAKFMHVRAECSAVQCSAETPFRRQLAISLVALSAQTTSLGPPLLSPEDGVYQASHGHRSAALRTCAQTMGISLPPAPLVAYQNHHSQRDLTAELRKCVQTMGIALPPAPLVACHHSQRDLAPHGAESCATPPSALPTHRAHPLLTWQLLCCVEIWTAGP